MKIILFLFLICIAQSSWAAYPNYTVCPSACDFNTLNGAVADMKANHATLDSPVTIIISGTWASADTTFVNFSSIVTSSINTITVTAVGNARNPGYFSNSSPYYRLVVNNGGSSALVDDINFVSINDIQVENTYSGAFNDDNAVYVGAAQSTSSPPIWDSDIFVSLGTNTGSQNGGLRTGQDNNPIFTNDIFEGANGVGFSGGAGGTHSIFYNCIFIGNSAYGFYASAVGSYGVTIYNSYAYGVTTAYNLLGSDNFLTTDASSDTTGSVGLQNIAYSTSNFTNVTLGSENFTLVPGSALIQKATNEFGTFTTDIIGATRQSSGSWDIGVFYYASTPPIIPSVTTINNAVIRNANIN